MDCFRQKSTMQSFKKGGYMNYYLAKTESCFNHAGVKGMKWGIRKAYEYAKSGLKAAWQNHKEKKKQNRLAKEGSRNTYEATGREIIMKMNPREMSAKDLRASIDRMALEKAYFQAYQENRTIVNPPKQQSFARKTIAKLATKAVNDILVDATVELGKQAVRNYGYKLLEDKIGIHAPNGGKNNKNPKKPDAKDGQTFKKN